MSQLDMLTDVKDLKPILKNALRAPYDFEQCTLGGVFDVGRTDTYASLRCSCNIPLKLKQFSQRDLSQGKR